VVAIVANRLMYGGKDSYGVKDSILTQVSCEVVDLIDYMYWLMGLATRQLADSDHVLVEVTLKLFKRRLK